MRCASGKIFFFQAVVNVIFLYILKDPKEDKGA